MSQRALVSIQSGRPLEYWLKAQQYLPPDALPPRPVEPPVTRRRAVAVADARFFADLAERYRRYLPEASVDDYLDILSQQALACEVAENHRAAALCFRRLHSEVRRLDPSGTKYFKTRSWALVNFASKRLLTARGGTGRLSLYDRALAWQQRAAQKKGPTAATDLPYYLLNKATACRVLGRNPESIDLCSQAIAIHTAQTTPSVVHRYELAFAYLERAQARRRTDPTRTSDHQAAIGVLKDLVAEGFQQYTALLIDAELKLLRSRPLTLESVAGTLRELEDMESLLRRYLHGQDRLDLQKDLPRVLASKARCMRFLDRDEEAFQIDREAIRLYEDAIARTGQMDLRQEYAAACSRTARDCCNDGRHLPEAIALARRSVRLWKVLLNRFDKPLFQEGLALAQTTLTCALCLNNRSDPAVPMELAKTKRCMKVCLRLGITLPDVVTEMVDQVQFLMPRPARTRKAPK